MCARGFLKDPEASVCGICASFFDKVLKVNDRRPLRVVAERRRSGRPGNEVFANDNCIVCSYTKLLQHEILPPELRICALFDSEKSDAKFTEREDGTLVLYEITYELWPGATIKCSIDPLNCTDRTVHGSILDSARPTPWYNRWSRRGMTNSGDISHTTKESTYNSIASTISSTGSKDTVHVVGFWLQQCETSHTLCQSRRSAAAGPDEWKPTRLLDLRPRRIRSDVICLREQGSLRPGCRYAAMSYCWGKDPSFLTLTRYTRRRLLGGVKVSKLPKTWKETIQFLRELSIRYLWIDALCIQQDDDEDWRREAANMSRTFGAALLTVSATASSNVDEGLFRERPIALVKGVTVPLQSTTGSSWHLAYSGTGLGLARYSSSPIAKRGWTLQEWLLPCRMVHFTQNMAYWECVEGSASEYDTTIRSRSQHDLSLKKTFSQLLNESAVGVDLHTVWNDIVYDYTRRELTKSTDKLFALQGIANEFSGLCASAGSYVAGMWKEHLLTDLLWATDALRTSKLFLARAPSWSWAAVEASVYWLAFHDSNTIEHPLVEVVDASWSLNSEYDAAQSRGRLRLRGALWKIGVRRLDQGSQPNQGILADKRPQEAFTRKKTIFGRQNHGAGPRLEFFAPGVSSKNSIAWINLSFPDVLTDGETHVRPIFFVPFYVMDRAATSTGTYDIGGCPVGLLLQHRHGERGVYIRIGSGYFNPRDPCKNPGSFVRWIDDIGEEFYIERHFDGSYVFDVF